MVREGDVLRSVASFMLGKLYVDEELWAWRVP